MAQGKSFFDDVKKEIECPVCQEQFSETKDPKILKCFHTFCKSCLEGWLRQQNGGALSCPNCRQITECPNNNINSLPSNLFYKQMVDIVTAYSGQGQEDSPHCGNCDERKSMKFYCSDCNCFLCEDCAGLHKKWKSFRGHHVKEIRNFQSTDVEDYARRSNICEQHKDKFRFFCEPCKICICRDCAILDHGDHKKITLEKGLELKKSELHVKIREAQTNGIRLRNHKKSLEERRLKVNDSFEHAMKELRKVAERRINLISQHEASVAEQLIKQKETFQVSFVNEMARLDGKQTEIDNSVQFGEELLFRNNLPEILNVEEMLNKRLQELSVPFEPTLSFPEVRYIPNDVSSLINAHGQLFTINTGLAEASQRDKVFLGSNANSLRRCEFELRKYQKEIAAPAIEGKNTVICAPTNSGKTYVAIEIVKQHLDRAAGGNSRRQPRVVLVVNTVNLVLRQNEMFEAYLGDKYPVGKVSGANSKGIPLQYLLQSHTIVVTTAQILVNALNRKYRVERVHLSDISLLLFHDCHHAYKEHSYNRIMQMYFSLKNQCGNKHSLPQIVGFTACFGTGKANSVEKAEEHILLVSANLDVEVISTVKENWSELENYVHVPRREIFNVGKDDKDPFERILSQVMDKIEALIERVKGKSHKASPADKVSHQYRLWVEALFKESIAEGDRFLVTYLEQLREYHVALTINTRITKKAAKRRLQRYFYSLNEEKFLPMDNKLKNVFQCAMKMLEKYEKEHGAPENPLLMTLKELLLTNHKEVGAQQVKEDVSEYAEEDSRGEPRKRVKGGPEGNKDTDRDEENKSRETADSMQEDDTSRGQIEWKGPKGILFTRTRESAEALLDWIKETEELSAVLRPDVLVGSGNGDIGMTQSEQQRVIKRFNSGEKNIILATSVAEGGLNIRDCHYVIRYEMMSNEISNVQSRGCLRSDEGKYIVLVSDNSGALKNEYTSLFREGLMIEALSKVREMDSQTFMQKVKDIQRKSFQDSYLKKHLLSTLTSVYLPGVVTFRCRKCNVEACQAYDIRTIKNCHHVVINSDFRDSKVDIKRHPYPESIDDVMSKKVCCKECHEDWGLTVLIAGVEWMCIKIRSFVLEFQDPNPQRKVFKNWKRLPFGIQEATIEELLQQTTGGAEDDTDWRFSVKS